MSLSVKDLENAEWDNVRLYSSRNTSEPLTQLAPRADTVTKDADSRSKTSSSTKRPDREASSTRSRDRRFNPSFNVSGGGEIRVQSVLHLSKNSQKNPRTTSDPPALCSVCPREMHMLMRHSMVSQLAKMSRKKENNWEINRTK